MRFSERWARPYRDHPWRLAEYAYELLDYERDARFALHLHDKAWFVDNYRVVVHGHCETPIGNVRCKHDGGAPVADGLQAVDRLIEIWTLDTTPDCAAIGCLDET